MEQYLAAAGLSNTKYHGHYDTGSYFTDNCTHSTEIDITPEQRGIGGPIVMIIVIILLAVIGNTVMICAVHRLAYNRTVTNVFTINLAISDLGIALLIMPMCIISLAMGEDNPVPITLCEAMAFMTVLLLLVSIATLSGISLDRYFSICHPMQYPQQVTINRVYCVIVYIWIQSMILSICPLIGWGEYMFRPQTIPICSSRWSNNIGFSVFLLLFGMILPCSAMLFAYIRIIQEARRQARRIESIQLKLVAPQEYKTDGSPIQNPDISRRLSLIERMQSMSLLHKRKSYASFSRNLKTLKTVFIIVGAFFACWGPYVLLNVWSVINSTKPIPYSADLITTLLVLGNSAVNPFVFIFLTRDLRWAVRMLVVRCLVGISKDELNRPGSRRSSKQQDSMIDRAQGICRASFDSEVEVDRNQLESRRRVSTLGTPIPRVLSTLTLRCDSIDSDGEDAERERISIISGTQTWPGTTLDVPDAVTHSLREGDIFSHDHKRKHVLVSQFGPTLKPPDPFHLLYERRLPSTTQHTEQQALFMTNQGYGAIEDDLTQKKKTRPLTYDQRIPILILPGDDSELLCNN